MQIKLKDFYNCRRDPMQHESLTRTICHVQYILKNKLFLRINNMKYMSCTSTHIRINYTYNY